MGVSTGCRRGRSWNDSSSVPCPVVEYLAGQLTHAEGPGALFTHGVGWLRRARVLLPGDSASVRVVPDAGGRTRLSVERLDALEIPESLVELCDLTAAMLPRVDLPELAGYRVCGPGAAGW
jgi:hypothetical protein